MTHLPFIAASYSLGLLTPGALALAAWHRLHQARLRLAGLDRRARR